MDASVAMQPMATAQCANQVSFSLIQQRNVNHVLATVGVVVEQKWSTALIVMIAWIVIQKQAIVLHANQRISCQMEPALTVRLDGTALMV